MSTNEAIEPRIAFLQGRPVILDVDLARIHHVPVRELREMVQQRFEHFPGDFCFQPEPLDLMRDTSGDPPYAFTEQGAWMTAAVLGKAPALLRAIEVSRAFERFRHGPRMPRHPIVH